MAELTGLSTQEVRAREAQGQTNVTPDKSDKTVAGIIASNVFTYFNSIFCLLAVLLVLAGSFKSLTFLPVIVANTIIGIVQQLRSKRVLDELALLDVSQYTVLREGEKQVVASNKLVLDDLVCLEGGQQIPADAVVVQGVAGVNESLLTGEADEIEKQAGDSLMSGSFVVGGNVIVRLTKVGMDSYAAQLTAQAKRTKERQSEMVHDIERIILVAGILIIPVGGLLFWQATNQNGMSFGQAVPSMVGAVIGMIPEGLYLLATIAFALSAMRLAKQQVLLHDMRSIETLARVDVLCVDKTGTITSDEMQVREVFAPLGGTPAQTREARRLLRQYVSTVPDNNATMDALRTFLEGGTPLQCDEVTPFTSKLKYSQVRMGSTILRLGAPEYLLDARTLELNRDLLEERAGGGMRVLAFVRGEQDETCPLLFVALENEVRENASQTFAEFARQGVHVKVISGDNPLTVSRVAVEAGIEHAEQYVDASSLTTPQKIREAVDLYTVFGRVKPEQKKELVVALRESGHKVAMTGDGVNDILAMKEADCSIAMGGGSDAARQAAQVVLMDSDFSHMRQIVLEGRRDINNITRSATLFLYKNLFSLALALFTIFGAFVYPLTPNQVSLISMFNIGLPAFLLAFEPNESRQEGRFLAEVLLRSLPAALTSCVAIAYIMLFADLFDVSQVEVATASMYLLSVVGFLILFGLIQPPNRYRIGVLLLCIVGFVACCGFLWQLFDVYHMSARAWVLCVVFAFSEVGIMQILSGVLSAVRDRYKL